MTKNISNFYDGKYDNSNIDYKKSKSELIEELIKGEKSGFVQNFNRKDFFNSLHEKH